MDTDIRKWKIEQFNRERRWRHRYQYVYLITWKDEGGIVSSDEGHEMFQWMKEFIGNAGEEWIVIGDAIGYADTLYIADKDKAMAFKLRYGHLVIDITEEK